MAHKEEGSKLAEVAIGDILGIGSALSQPKQFDASSKPYVALPDGWKLHDLSAFLPYPKRYAGALDFGDVDSFIRYVNKHKDVAGAASAAATGGGIGAGSATSAPVDPDDMQTILLVDIINSKFLACFDHHASDQPGWREHKVSYTCPLSPQWRTWNANSGRKMGQEDFAFFIEQNEIDIVDPTGATMLEIVTTLKSAKSVHFDSGVRLSDGRVQLKYHEEHDTRAGAAGQLAIPEKIKLGIPVYIGGPAYEVILNFRYRIDNGKIAMWYDILRPERILEDSLNKVIAKVAEGTGIKPYSVTAATV